MREMVDNEKKASQLNLPYPLLDLTDSIAPPPTHAGLKNLEVRTLLLICSFARLLARSLARSLSRSQARECQGR